jgi:hypothetical protein
VRWELAAGVTVAGVAGLLRLVAATAGPVIVPDSFDYASQSRLSIFDGRFWSSQHPPLLPLLWKVDPSAVSLSKLAEMGSSGVIGYAGSGALFEDVRPLVMVNVVVAVISWSALAFAAASLFETRAVRWSAFIAVLWLSLAPEVAGWDGSLLSESVSLSLLALLAALLIWHLQRPSRRLAVAAAAVIFLSCMNRDTATLLMLAVVIACVVLRTPYSRLIVAGLIAGVIVVGWGNHASTQRAELPVRNSVAYAIQIRHDGAWFAARGLPMSPNPVGVLLSRPTSAFDTAPKDAAVHAWLTKNGRSIWLQYLIDHPDYLASLVRDLPRQADGQTAAISATVERSRLLAFSPYRHGALFWAMLAFGALALWPMRDRRVFVFVAAIVCADVATLLLVPALDRMDIERHALFAGVTLRFVSVGLVLAAIDRLLVTRRASSVASTPREAFT